MVRDGWAYGASFGLAAAVTGLAFGSWLGALACAGCGSFALYFFRDPDREIPPGPVCVAPADGRVVQVRAEPDGRTRISIFLSIFDVHVNRAPVSGRVLSMRYSPGRFRMAHLASASVENERNTLVVEDLESGSTVELSQIAGLIARRIVCRKQVGDDIEKGERLGLIKFGSRTDLVLGSEWDLRVRPGDRVRGGNSVLASRK